MKSSINQQSRSRSYGDFRNAENTDEFGGSATTTDGDSVAKVRFSNSVLNSSPSFARFTSPNSSGRQLYKVNDDGSKRSSREVISQYKKRASHILDPVRKIKETESVNSFRRETKHFIDITAMHGPKRIGYGKRYAKVFWAIMVLGSASLLILQIVSLINQYINNPTITQVSFVIEQGLDLPLVTICNFNPVRKTFVQDLNSTGDFSQELFDYIIQSNAEPASLYSGADRSELHIGNEQLVAYQSGHPNFTINGFFIEGGLDCADIMKSCSFGGRLFDCCKYMKPELTNMGKCYTMNLVASDVDWLHQQVTPGVESGLQIIVDAHLEEQYNGTEVEATPSFSNSLEDGYRYFVHAPNTVSYLASEGISASPGSVVYSALTLNKYTLLSHHDRGNCTEEWPQGFTTKLPYSAINCQTLCNAKFFFDRCGCSPFVYDIALEFPVCTPYETVMCIDKHVRKANEKGDDIFVLPNCMECKVGCNSNVYSAFNSYGHGFSEGSLKWLNKKNSTWTYEHMKTNFLAINVFFKDMAMIEYAQVQASSITTLLSNIGGNMGLFLGMSVITCTESLLFISKMIWIAISKKRRNYMYQKKQREAEKARQLEETVNEFSTVKHNLDSMVNLHALAQSFQTTPEIHRKTEEKTERRNTFLSDDHPNLYNEKAQNSSPILKPRSTVIEMGIDNLSMNIPEPFPPQSASSSSSIESLHQNRNPTDDSNNIFFLG